MAAVADSCRFVHALSVSDYFLMLKDSGRLIGQTDPRLMDRGYIVHNGGLCASACVVNAANAALSFGGLDTRVFSQRADQMIGGVITFVKDRFGYDARMGITELSHLPALIDYLVKGLNSSIAISHQSVGGFRNKTIIKKLTPAHNEIKIVGLVRVSGRRHAIVLIEIDEKTQHIRYADPNYPSEIFKVPYKIAFAMPNFTIKIENPVFTEDTYVEEVVTISVGR